MPSFAPRTFPQYQMSVTSPNPNPLWTGDMSALAQMSTGTYGYMSSHSARRENMAYGSLDQSNSRASLAPGGQVVYPHQPQPPSYSRIDMRPSFPRHAHQNQHYPDYGPIAAPVLPPIRIRDQPYEQPKSQTQSVHQNHPPRADPSKGEKVMGGVAAHLDYDMSQMAEFVAEMAQGIVEPSSPVSPAFRKFVSQVLTSTRLPSSTILLGLYYLASRTFRLRAASDFKPTNSQIYRLFTVGLVLGSKFLDDNTFQNRSWSEVTGLATSELNELEMEWLVDADWNLHVDPVEHKGFASWRATWADWKVNAASQVTNDAKLAHIDTALARRSPAPMLRTPPTQPPELQSGRFENMQPHFVSASHGQSWSRTNSMVEYSPPSASGSGPNTPEYFGLGGPWSVRSAPPPYSMRQTGHSYSQPPSYHHTPFPQYPQSIWNAHNNSCPCMFCCRTKDSFSMTPAFGPQSVAG